MDNSVVRVPPIHVASLRLKTLEVWDPSQRYVASLRLKTLEVWDPSQRTQGLCLAIARNRHLTAFGFQDTYGMGTKLPQSPKLT